MNYEQFKKKVLEEFIGYLDNEFKDYQLKVNKVMKVNQVLTGVCVAPQDPPRAYAAPTFYIEYMYEEYKDGVPFPVIMANTARVMENALKGEKPKVPSFSARSILDNVVMQLIGVAGNEEYIKGLPHREFLDMVIIYRRLISFDECGVMSFVIDNDLADYAKITEEQLYKKAYKNTDKILKPICRDMRTLLKDMSGGVDIPESEDPSEPKIFVITNEHKYLAATALLYPQVFEDITRDLGSDLVILPSSVHDLIVMPDDVHFEGSGLKEIVEDVNSNHMSKAEVLSSNVYRYKKGDLKVSFYDRLVDDIAG